MARPRPHLLLVPAALSLAACTSSDNCLCESVATYVVSRASLPTTSQEATAIGLDLNGDGVIDNQLGAALAALDPQGVDVPAATTAAIDRGDIILLLQLLSPGTSKPHRAAFEIEFGDPASAEPAPCADPTDAVCRRHLDGTGSFSVAASSPNISGVAGELAAGTFEGDPGDLSREISLELALGGPGKIRLDLIGARAQASGISDAGIERLVLAGGLPEEQFVPTFLGILNWTVARDCTGTAPPDCGCKAGSSGRIMLDLFDQNPQDCTLTVEEIQTADLVLLKAGPDLTIDGRGAYSFGIELAAVKGAIR